MYPRYAPYDAFMRLRQIDHSTHAVTKYASLHDFTKSSEIPAGLLSITVNDLPIDMLNVVKESDTTVIFLHGAIESHYKIPYLTGQGISADLNVNRIFVSDPALALSDKLLLSWFAGSYKQPEGQQDIARIVGKILDSTGSKRAIFFGGSGGGFAALNLATYFDNALAMAYNPQTNITQYNAKAIHDFTRHAHGIHPREYDPLKFLPNSVITDICPVYAERQTTTVAYLQNLNDHTHVNRQLRPFLDALHPENDVHLLAAPWGAGHTAPPKDLLRQTLKTLCDGRGWAASLANSGFEKLTAQSAARYAAEGVPGTYVHPDPSVRSFFPKYDEGNRRVQALA